MSPFNFKTSFSELFQPKLFTSLKGYNKVTFAADAVSGVIVAIVAIPLAIAFAIACGPKVGPAEGLITAIVAGFLISFFGGSKVQIGGPTGAFVPVIALIIQQNGVGGLMVATIMAGIILIVMGICKLGSIIKFVPYPVIVGFTGGIAVIIFSQQMNNLFGWGIDPNEVPADFIHQWICYFRHFTQIDGWTLGIGVAALGIIILSPKFSKKIPGSFIAIVLITLVVWILKTYFNIGNISTIGDLYQLPEKIPAPRMPHIALEQGKTIFNTIEQLFPAAFTIAMLGAIEALLSATVADGATGDKHNSNTELIGQGIANVVTPFFGGIPATGAIARTMTNINNGGRTPVAGIIHAAVLLFVLLFMSRLVAYIPMACLAAVLVIVCYNMSGWRAFVSLAKSPKSDFIVLIVTFVLTLVFGLTMGIGIGLLLAIVLFIRRISETSVIRTFHNEIDPNENNDISLKEEKLTIPAGVEVYEIDGPYFFGIANKFDEIMQTIGESPQVRIIRMRKVPFIDSTGIHNLKTLCRQSKREGIHVILSGVNGDVCATLKKADFDELLGNENICSHINEALEKAGRVIDKRGELSTF
jgi:SulP family sulfate permease